MWVESSNARRAEAQGGVAGAGRGGLVNTLPIHQELDVCGVLFGCFLLGFPPRPACVSPGGGDALSLFPLSFSLPLL